ncbi:MAG: TIR domain-containing protein [Bacteroidetes bacterium]|nr:TIR domain-containing protein [Bacteroidota bacterium]
MADIFISYSRHDSEQALGLVAHLRAQGVDVWIDQHGIEGAASWSKEIANALESCHTMLLLLSPTAVTSENVAKELAAATQLKKRIVPVQVIRTALSGEFLYHLSGLQRVKIADVDGILRAINTSKSSAIPIQPKAVQPVDERKSLMILPFKDLSPTADNGWFADGIVSELIDSLSRVKSLRLVDKQTTSEYKTYQGHLADYAREMRIRYFLQGDVRKFGDQIKISCTLLDIDTADHLWQISHKGTMSDIFDMQEELARKVVDGLKVHLLASEEKKLANRGTSNAEAYEMYLKSAEFFGKHTKVGTEHALASIRRALELDPNFPQAMLRCAIILITLHQHFGWPANVLDEADRLLEAARLVLSPTDDWRVLGTHALRLWVSGDPDAAEALMRENLRIDPADTDRLNQLGVFHSVQHRFSEALVEFEAIFALTPDSYRAARTLIGTAWALRDRDRKVQYAHQFFDLVVARMSTMPDDDDARIVYGLLLVYQGRIDEARQQLHAFPDDHIVIEESYRNLAGLAAMVGEGDRAIRLLQTFTERFGTTLTAEHLLWFSDQEFEPISDREEFIRLEEEWTRRVHSNG